ncbi:hypothetical protein, partial [Nocardia cyriacigeorgica]|uniref:hypothetical protein n=1 Tax=Nocardia cyriacigeorgica TaxID=135487 RepID=UPI001C49A02A
SIVSLVISFVFGIATSFYGPRIPDDLPPPWAGVLERISVAAFVLWLAVLASTLLRTTAEPPGGEQAGTTE